VVRVCSVHAAREAQVTSDQLEQTFRKYAWDYFAVHAAQRLAAFQFFITLATAIVGGYIALVGTGGQKWMALLGLLLSTLAFVFYKLDCRTKELIKNAESALSYLDSQHHLPDVDLLPSPLRLVDRDRVACAGTQLKGVFKKRYSYSRCFAIIFLTFGALGAIAAIVSISVFPLAEKDKKTQGASFTNINLTSEKREDRNSKGDQSAGR
jgi:hypothetical protein